MGEDRVYTGFDWGAGDLSTEVDVAQHADGTMTIVAFRQWKYEIEGEIARALSPSLPAPSDARKAT